jgi:hypothetical protein
MKKLLTVIFFSLLSVNAYCGLDIPFPANLKMAGDIRTKWKSEWGGKDTHSFKTEATLGCDYEMPEAWVSVKMKAATSNGKDSLIFLDKAFLGYQFYDGLKTGLGMEIGRNKMESMFDSKMQFDSYFNGLHIVYTYNQPDLFNFTLHGGPHVVNSEMHHYGWIAEGIWSNIAATPLTLKYSFTDWNAPRIKNGQSYSYAENYLFTISQMTVAYQISDTTLYGAYLLNHQENHYNDGFYLGFTMGKIRQKGDFSFDVNFQSSKNRLISPVDFKGLKKGVQAKVMYALAAPLNVEAKFTLYDDHNGSNNNKRLEMSAVYAW